MINYVFDGQHTIEAVALVSNSRETPVWCMIYDHLCYEHEAHIFAEQQKHHRSVAPYDTFNAHLESGSEKHLLIRDLVLSYNLELGSTQKRHGTICAIAALENIFDTYGYHVLDKALRMLVSTWEGEMYSLSGNTLNAMARLIAAYGDALNGMPLWPSSPVSGRASPPPPIRHGHRSPHGSAACGMGSAPRHQRCGMV